MEVELIGDGPVTILRQRVGGGVSVGGKHFHHYNIGIALLAAWLPSACAEPSGNGIIPRPRSPSGRRMR